MKIEFKDEQSSPMSIDLNLFLANESFLKLDGFCIGNPSIIPLNDPKCVKKLSLTKNFLLSFPEFISDLENLIEIDAKENFLQTFDFLVTSNFDFVERLNLSKNRISSFPTRIDRLRTLTDLDLSMNFLRELPSNFGDFIFLKKLNVKKNFLEQLPSTLPRLVELQSLDLSQNQFESLDLLKNFKHLVDLKINENPLKSFPELLFSCPNLENFSASNCNFDRFVDISFDYFRQFLNLKSLDLSSNRLCNDFFRISNENTFGLFELNLKKNHLNNVDSMLKILKKLVILNLSENEFVRLPKELSSTLKILRLSSNKIKFTEENFLQLKFIVELELDGNSIDHIGKEFEICQKLKSLNISSNPLGEFPSVLFNLRALKRLVSQHQHWSNWSSMANFRSLTILILSHQNFKGKCSELTNLRSLTTLDLSFNQLSELDDDFSFCSSIKHFNLSHNRFVELPRCFTEFSDDGKENFLADSLVELHLNNNKLRSIPEEFSRLKHLEVLDLSNNRFDVFPQAIVYLDGLISLRFSGHRIDVLPDNFKNLRQLQRLDLSHNSFTEIPSVINELKELKNLNFSDNLLTHVEMKKFEDFARLSLEENFISSFSSSIFQIENVEIRRNHFCFSPPNDLIEENFPSAEAQRFSRQFDRFEEILFGIYREIFVKNLAESDIERFLIRFKFDTNEIESIRNEIRSKKREEKIGILFDRWKQKRSSFANTHTLEHLTKIIADKRLFEQIQRAKIFARQVRI